VVATRFAFCAAAQVQHDSPADCAEQNEDSNVPRFDIEVHESLIVDELHPSQDVIDKDHDFLRHQHQLYHQPSF